MVRKLFPRVTAPVSTGLVCLLLAISTFAAQGTTQKSEATPPPSRIDPKCQELIDKAIAALGGQAFLNFKSLSSKGRIFSISEGETAGFAPFESAVLYPDKRRFSYGSKKPVTLVNNGDRAWQLDRYGMTRQNPEQVRRWRISSRYGLESLLRIRIHEPGVLIQDGGVDFVDNVAARVVEIIDVQQVHAKLYINKVNFLPVRISYRLQNPQTRDWEEFAEVYGDYKKIQYVQTPMHISRFMDGERFSEVFRNSAQYDETFPPDYFEPVG